MKTKQWAALIPLCATLTMFSVGSAEAATGTITFTLNYKDPITNVVTPVGRAFTYLHDATKPPPMEKFFSKADCILWGPIGNGSYSITGVPEGKWYIRITQRADPAKQTFSWAHGPPQSGDLTWMQPAPITITAGQTLNLGTLYSAPFAPVPITITGTVKNYSGAPLAGRYVRAQTEPCDGYNDCGPVKLLALQTTDANGNFTLQLRDPGTYYIYTASTLNYDGPGCNGYCAPSILGTGYVVNGQLQPVTVHRGDNKTINIITN
jgi:hypothetical protein